MAVIIGQRINGKQSLLISFAAALTYQCSCYLKFMPI